MAFDVLAIARFLADQHERCASATFAENRLRGLTIEIAAVAVCCGLAQTCERNRLREEVRCGTFTLSHLV